MIINGSALLARAPILEMASEKITLAGGSYGLSEVGYDIRIKQDIRFHVDEDGPHISIDGVWRKGRFALASSVEEFNMPDDLMAVGHDKSTWARHGVQVFNTVAEPAWRGFLTLELVFNGEEAVHIPAGTGIMQMIFHKPMLAAEYVGKYQDQEDAPVPPKT